MLKYHVNDEGNVGICTAQFSCPFGDASQHYDNPQDVRLAFEKVNEQKKFAVVSHSQIQDPSDALDSRNSDSMNSPATLGDAPSPVLAEDNVGDDDSTLTEENFALYNSSMGAENNDSGGNESQTAGDVSKNSSNPFLDDNDLKKDKDYFVGRFPSEDASRTVDGAHFWSLQDEAVEFQNSLPQQKQRALDYYRSFRYYKLNDDLWNGVDLSGEDSDSPDFNSEADVAASLDAAVASAPREDKIVYRGIKDFKLSEGKSNLYSGGFNVGDSFVNKGFMSATYDLDHARQFSGLGGVVFEISTDGGANLGTMEVEVLLARDSKWVVANKTTIMHNGVPVELVQIVEDK